MRQDKHDEKGRDSLFNFSSFSHSKHYQTFKSYWPMMAYSFPILFLFFQVIFGHGGLKDYQDMIEHLEKKKDKIQEVIQSNERLEKEITRLQYQEPYQKKIVRHYLGVIAQDEYLVLFGDSKRKESI